MHPIEAFVRNPVKVWVGTILIGLFGVVAWYRMPMQLTPEVQIPTITIETLWPGASPEDIEREIVQEQEEQLKGVQGVVKMSSEATDSVGRVTLEFKVGTNMQEALLLVNSRLQQVREYPIDADEPVISTSGSSDSPIAWFVISARLPEREVFEKFAQEHPEHQAAIQSILTSTNPSIAEIRTRYLAKDFPPAEVLLPRDLNVPDWRKFAENVIESAFERVPGVSNANVIGGVDPELQVIVDPEKLAARELTITHVRSVLQGQNADTSAGDVWDQKSRWVVRTKNRFESPADVEKQILALTNGSPVYLSDVAEVREAFKKPDGFVRRFGQKGVAVNVIRESGANVLKVMEGLRATRQQLNDGILKERGLLLTQVYDETEYIYDALGLVRENIFSGSALTMISLMLCLHLTRRTFLFSPLILLTSLLSVYVSSWWFVVCMALILIAGFWFARGALVIGLTIPACLIGTFLCLDLLQMSLNVISLAGLAFAVGIVVDNATVVLENIYRHYQMGRPPLIAAIEATKEVWGAVLASTATNLSVFLPVLFVQDEAGQLFRDISLAIAGSTALSLFFAVTLIPVVAARLLQQGTDLGDFGEESPAVRSGASTNRTSFFIHLLESSSARFIEATVQLNAWIQQTTLRRLVVVGLMTAIASYLSYLYWPRVEYLPAGNRNLVIGLVLPPPGYNLDELDRLGDIVEKELRPFWDVPNDVTSVKVPIPGAEGQMMEIPAVDDFFFVARGRSVFLGLKAKKKTEARKLIPLIMQMTPKMPGSIAVAFQTSLFSRGLQAGRAIDIEIVGPELPQLRAYGGQIIGQVASVLEPNNPQPQTQARPIPDLSPGGPEMHFLPLEVQSRELGFMASEIGYTINALVDGAYAGDYYVVQTAENDPNSPFSHIRGDKIDLSIVGAKKNSERIEQIDELPVATPIGQLVPLSAIAKRELTVGPEQINRRERKRAITIQVTPPPAMPLEEAIRVIEAKIIGPMRASGQLQPGYQIIMGGTVDKLRQTWESLGFNVVLAAIITYLLMAALFESWLHPATVMLSVPLGAVGGIVGLDWLNRYLVLLGEVPQALDVLTMLGFVILIGTVVNNPILIIHQALNHMREDQLSATAAVLESVRNRIRPIFITTLTTVIGLIPLVMFPGAGSELYRGLGAVVLGGIMVSTIFTLVLVPATFTLMLDLKRACGFKMAEEQPAVDVAPSIGQQSSVAAEAAAEKNEEEPALRKHEPAAAIAEVEQSR